MRTASLNPMQAHIFAIVLTSAKIIVPTLLLLYGVFHFSTFHWVILGMIVTGVMAISDRVSRMSAPQQTETRVKPNVVNSDGGTFHKIQQPKPQKSASPVVFDGGIVKSKVSNLKSRS